MGNNMVIRPDDLSTDDKEQILEAIRTGRVDAFVVEEHEGHAVYALQNADLPYSALVQRMQQGAAMLNSRGEIVFCNPSLSTLLGESAAGLIGTPLQKLVEPGDRGKFQKLFESKQEGSTEGELRICHSDGSIIPARFSFTALSGDKSIVGVLITDLTTEKSNADLASRIQRVQDDERRGLARELHDSVGQLLAALTMNLASLRQGVSGLTPPNLALLEDSAVMVDQVSREIRTISHLLHPPLLDIAGISSAIRWYVDGFSERSRIKVDLDLPPDLGRLSTDVETALFRVVQECLTNVYRHSGSNSCSVTLTRQVSGLQLTIRDFGHGMPQPVKGKTSSGIGLRGMQERLLLLGGTLEIASSTSGTSVTASLPVTSSAAEPDVQAV